jgi:hypothetical protein
LLGYLLLKEAISGGSAMGKALIYSDPWIPSSPDRRIITPRGEVVLTKVAEVIDPITGRWDEELL